MLHQTAIGLKEGRNYLWSSGDCSLSKTLASIPAEIFSPCQAKSDISVPSIQSDLARPWGDKLRSGGLRLRARRLMLCLVGDATSGEGLSGVWGSRKTWWAAHGLGTVRRATGAANFWGPTLCAAGPCHGGARQTGIPRDVEMRVVKVPRIPASKKNGLFPVVELVVGVGSQQRLDAAYPCFHVVIA